MRRENNTLILSLVQDRRENEDQTEAGLRPVQPIFWDRRSRFGPVDQQSVGLWPSLRTITTQGAHTSLVRILSILLFLCW